MIALARFVETHAKESTRAALIGSYRGAVRLGAELQAASLAGKALSAHDDIEAALASLEGDEWVVCGARAYLKMVRGEERGQPSEAPVRYMGGRSDEGDGRG